MIDWDRHVGAPLMKVFGETSKPQYTRASGGAAFSVDGIFDDAYMALVLNDGDAPEIATIEPTMGVRAAQFAGVLPVKGDIVTVPRVARTYRVVAVEPDGKGAIYLRLQIKKP